MQTKTILNFISANILLIFLLGGSFVVFGQVSQEADWKWQNPLPTGNTLYDIKFMDMQNGWSVGDYGTILKTSNGGQSWSSQKSGTINRLNSVHFLNTQTGWIIGNEGTILKTIDGGESWVKKSSGTVNSLISVHFVDSLFGWAVGAFGTILKTSNGGQTWINQSVVINATLNSVYFVNSLTGWAVGGVGTILKTTNGGESWLNQQNTGWQSYTLFSIKFINSQTGWAVGNEGTILKTNNGGQNWIAQNSGVTTFLYSIHLIDAQKIWAVGPGGSFLRSSNGGQNWVTQNSGTTALIRSVHFVDFQNGWVVGIQGTIKRTNDGGMSWVNQNNTMKNDLLSVCFVDSQIGWAVGKFGTILKTRNGGQSWSNQSTGTTKTINSVHFNNSQNGFAVGSGGTILKTSNGGQSWVSQSNGTTIDLYSVYFADDQRGWAVGDGASFLNTTNGGQNWISQTSGSINSLRCIKFITPQIGWAIGLGGSILKSSNGGISWFFQNSGTINNLYSVYFIDSQIGWAVGNDGTILKTINSGNSWQIQVSGTTQTLWSVHFTDAQNGWAVGENGTILKTSNAGNSWLKQNSSTANLLNSIYFINPLYGWAVGEYGTILTTITNIPINLEVPNALLSGRLFEKTSSNCESANNPIPVLYRMVKAIPGPYFGISNSDGFYNIRIPLSSSSVGFNLHPVIPTSTFQFNTVCPPSGQISFIIDTIPDTLSDKDFGFEILPCHHLEVQVASNRRRRCFKNITSISYANQGSLSSPNGYILVEFPQWVRPISTSRSYVALNDSVWRFNLDTVSAGESGSFTITDSVICGNLGILGLSQCTKATIFPAPDCPPPAGYNGAEITVSGKCNDGFVSLGIYNKSNTDMADSVNYWVYLDSIQVKQAKVKLAAGDSLKLWVDSQGWAVHLTVNQVQNHPTELFVSTTVESCGDTFIFYPRQTVNRFAKQQRPNSKTHCLPVIGAYDPNDKQAFPIGFTNQNIIPPNTQLDYLVRFQNTGNDTAFTVYVIDTLDQNLNVESFEMGAASHNYQLSMQTEKSGKTFLRWQFNNIQLPDSNVNEPASNGFIQFRISPKAGLALGSKVRNHAEIYFDFNPPIITNQTLTTYNLITFRDTSLNNNVQIVTAAKGKLSPKQIGVNLYPNPVTEHSLTADFQTKGSLILFNAQGQLVFEKQNIEGKQVLPIQLRTGFYMAQLRTEKGVSVVKIVVE